MLLQGTTVPQLGHKKGHISRMCRSKETVNNEKAVKQNKFRKKKMVHHVDTKEMYSNDCSATDTELMLNMVVSGGTSITRVLNQKCKGRQLKWNWTQALQCL